jgi:hypothetical protein
VIKSGKSRFVYHSHRLYFCLVICLMTLHRSLRQISLPPPLLRLTSLPAANISKIKMNNMNISSVNTRTSKAIFAFLTAAVLIVANPLASNANGINDDKKPSNLTEKQVSVNYVGANDNNLIFRVDFENPTAGKFWLIIKNDAGEVVYQKQFNDVHFSKAVYIPQEETDITPTFIIRNGNDEVVRQFSVNRKVVENTVVTRL